MKKFISSALCLGVILFTSTKSTAQEKDNKVKIDVTVTKDGETQNIVKEIEIPNTDNLKQLLNEVEGLENIDISLEDGDLEIIVKRKGESEFFSAKNFKFPEGFEINELAEGKESAFMGIVGGNTDGEVSLSRIIEGEAADKAGLKVGDVVKKFDGEKIENYSELVKLIRTKKPGDKVEVKVERDGETEKVDLELGKRTNSHSFFSTNRVIEWNGDEKEMRFFKDKLKSEVERGFLGIRFTMEDNGGVPITKIVTDSPAEEAELMPKDVIIKVNGEKVENGSSFNEVMKEMKPGDNLELTIDRDGKTIGKSVKLAKRNTFFKTKEGMPNNLMNHDFNFGFDNSATYSFGDKIIVKVKVEKVTNEEEEMLNEALGLKSSSRFDDVDFKVYPNPSNGKFSIEAEIKDVEKLELGVFDLKGSKVNEARLRNEDGEFSTEIDITNYPAGTYFLVLKNGNKTFTEKLVKR